MESALFDASYNQFMPERIDRNMSYLDIEFAPTLSYTTNTYIIRDLYHALKTFLIWLCLIHSLALTSTHEMDRQVRIFAIIHNNTVNPHKKYSLYAEATHSRN